MTVRTRPEQAGGPRGAGETPSVRILVAEPPPEKAEDGFDVVAALRRLGRDASLELHREPGAVAAALRQGVGDLVVLDQALGDEFWQALEVARSLAVPALAILRGEDDGFALEAYRAGAADCIVAGPEAADLLPIAALEQLRRLHRVPAAPPSKELEREVDDLRRVNEQIIQTMNSALVLIAASGRVAYANPMAERLLGVGSGELVGAAVADWFPDAAGDGRHPLATLETGEPVRGTEMVLTRSDGGLIPVGLSCAPMEDGAGSREGVVAIFQDLTEIKQLQRQVLQTEKMASIGQLAAGIAHEINNPMGFIHANLCQLSEYLDDLHKVWERVEALRVASTREQVDREAVREAARELDATIREVDAGFLLEDFGTALRESLEGSGRIREIVRDLRAFSHPDTSRLAPTDVNRALDSTAHIVWTMMKHSVVLTKQYAELPPIEGFPVQLQQVFMNLLVNAYQAIEARAATEEAFRGEIKLRTRVDGDDVVVEIGDNGTGIEPEVAARIFDPFYTTKEVGVGMGLGLSTSFTLVRQHGGSLRVDSEPGRGTTFEVRIPIGGDGRRDE